MRRLSVNSVAHERSFCGTNQRDGRADRFDRHAQAHVRRVDELEQFLREDRLADDQRFHLFERDVRRVEAGNQPQSGEPVRRGPLPGDEPRPGEEVTLKQFEAQRTAMIVLFGRLHFFGQQRDREPPQAIHLGAKGLGIGAEIHLHDRRHSQQAVVAGEIDKIVEGQSKPRLNQLRQGRDECLGRLGVFEQLQHDAIGRECGAVAAEDEARPN